jgi:hypothetical protein
LDVASLLEGVTLDLWTLNLFVAATEEVVCLVVGTMHNKKISNYHRSKLVTSAPT